MEFITNNAILMLEKSLGYNWQKQNIISENIAHKDTPGYKAKYVTFEESLRQNLGKYSSTDSVTSSEIQNRINSAKTLVRQANNETARLDGNNVNIDAEYVELARTQLQYEYLVKQINDQFNRLRTVIEGR